MNEIDKLAWLHLNDKQLLVARSKGKENYYIPGGKREPDESDHVALVREIKEELSVDLLLNTIKYMGTFTAQADSKPTDTLVKLTCYVAEFTGTLQAAAEIEELRWVRYEDKACCSLVTQIVMDWLKAEGLI